MSKTQTIFRLTAMALGLACAAAHAQAQERVRIGFMSPVTGPQAANGGDNRDGALLAIKELNAKGVKVAGKPVVFELDINDDVADPKQGVQVAQTLADKKIRFVLGPYNSGVTVPAARVLNDSDILTLTVASNPKITELGYGTLFRIGASDNQLGTKMATYAAQDLKLKTVAVIDDRTAYGQGVAREFTAQARRLGLQVVATEFTTDKATDFSAILTNIRGAKAEAVFYGGYSPQGGPLLKQMRALGITGPLLGGDGICSTETANLAQLTGDLNVFCTQGGSMLDKSDKGQKFAERYRAEYKRDPLTYAAAFYDGMHLLANAMESAQSTTDTKKIAQAIANGKYAGVTGEFSYDAKHDLKSSAVTVYTFKGKDVVPLKSL
ncbi:branched-chain amino acid ABC transporter substrate-binding protein [Paracidovorax avenae]|uniref:branched-chain amino acid ABC transporter substrate-binding protein n=1 Tax=Paracidovorax avenae TaxID=80867 RepID=UPI0006B39D39|nr:branched-chain amino acid ABC transporter substrate-binding protein [Paracidovorax avenae]